MAKMYSFKHFAVILVILIVFSIATVKLFTLDENGYITNFSWFSYRPLIQLTNFLTSAKEPLLNDVQCVVNNMEKCFEVTNLGVFDGLSKEKAKMKAENYIQESSEK